MASEAQGDVKIANQGVNCTTCSAIGVKKSW